MLPKYENSLLLNILEKLPFDTLNTYINGAQVIVYQTCHFHNQSLQILPK